MNIGESQVSPELRNRLVIVLKKILCRADGFLHITPWGDPDTQGVYTAEDFVGVPLERPVDVLPDVVVS